MNNENKRTRWTNSEIRKYIVFHGRLNLKEIAKYLDKNISATRLMRNKMKYATILNYKGKGLIEDLLTLSIKKLKDQLEDCNDTSDS